MDPSLFYTGIVAELYSPLRSAVPDPETYAKFIGASGEPALELGCGTGDPLLALRQRGIDIEGVDSSADMLDICRTRAEEQSLSVVVHHQRMESLALSRRYRSIFLAGPTFNLLPDDTLAGAALQRIRAHLTDGGSALIPLFIPQPTPVERLGEVREARESDGSTIRVSAIAEVRDETSRCQTTTLRYERAAGTTTDVVERPWVLHWHSQDSFRALAASAGLATAMILDPAGARAAETAQEFAFWLKAAASPGDNPLD